MTLDSAIDTVNHIERSSRGAAMPDIPGPDIERKEFGCHATVLHALQAGAIRDRRRAAEIVIIIGHRCRYVVVRVDDDCAPVNSERFLPELFVSWSLSGNWRNTWQGQKDEADRNKSLHLI